MVSVKSLISSASGCAFTGAGDLTSCCVRTAIGDVMDPVSAVWDSGGPGFDLALLTAKVWDACVLSGGGLAPASARSGLVPGLARRFSSSSILENSGPVMELWLSDL